ncbi:hypothetical protein BJY01DRAFT_251178 [Aspergillus pseudoustus]|uniref:Uncharacterized protein n=1 Tax=Aspergillus pseudoustus TaxID=1810923 RepID=A0ABR4JDY3_9EURO
MGLGKLLKVIIIPVAIFILIIIGIAICLTTRRNKKQKERELELHSKQYQPPVITQWGPSPPLASSTPAYSPAEIQQPAPTYTSHAGNSSFKSPTEMV